MKVLENGKIKHLSESTIRKFCKLLDCNIIHLYRLADIDVFDTKIKTWTQFYKSLSDLHDNKASEFIDLASKLNTVNQ